MCKINEPSLMKASPCGSPIFHQFIMTVNLNGQEIQVNQMKDWVDQYAFDQYIQFRVRIGALDFGDEQFQMEDDDLRKRDFEAFRNRFGDYDTLISTQGEEGFEDMLRTHQDEGWDEWPGQWRDFMDRLHRGEFIHHI